MGGIDLGKHCTMYQFNVQSNLSVVESYSYNILNQQQSAAESSISLLEIENTLYFSFLHIQLTYFS